MKSEFTSEYLITIMAWLRSKWKYEGLKWVILIVPNFPFWSFAWKGFDPHGLKNTIHIGKTFWVVIQFCNVNDTQATAQAPPTQWRWQKQTLLTPGMYCQNLGGPHYCCSAPFHTGCVSLTGKRWFFTAVCLYEQNWLFKELDSYNISSLHNSASDLLITHHPKHTQNL